MARSKRQNLPRCFAPRGQINRLLFRPHKCNHPALGAQAFPTSLDVPSSRSGVRRAQEGRSGCGCRDPRSGLPVRPETRWKQNPPPSQPQGWPSDPQAPSLHTGGCQSAEGRCQRLPDRAIVPHGPGCPCAGDPGHQAPAMGEAGTFHQEPLSIRWSESCVGPAVPSWGLGPQREKRA